jgi:hypothetical protein
MIARVRRISDKGRPVEGVVRELPLHAIFFPELFQLVPTPSVQSR